MSSTVTEVRVRPLRRVEYDLLIDAGLLTEDEPIELLDGEMVETVPEGVRVRPLRRVEYDLLVDHGVFDEDERIQLLDGEMVEMSPQRAPHALTIQSLTMRLVPALLDHAELRVQLPFAVGEVSEPEPDIAIVPLDAPRDRHPDTALLIIEVAETSRMVDLGRKARMYAAAGVPEYWVMDIAAPAVHVHTDPGLDGYASVAVHGADQELSAAGVPLRLRDLLPGGQAAPA